MEGNLLGFGKVTILVICKVGFKVGRSSMQENQEGSNFLYFQKRIDSL